jgi:sRNA-binding protein
MTDAELALALQFYTGSSGYLQACREGVDRIDLAGKPAGQVTAEQTAHAQRRIADRLEQKLANGHDKEARPASLTDLRNAARARREGGAK